jgi:hypothetical protein
MHPKGGLPASRTCSHYSMAPPIKQENLSAMEDCRLLLKNAIDIKLKASHQHFHDAMALVDSSFLGHSVRDIIIRGGLRGSNNH